MFCTHVNKVDLFRIFLSVICRLYLNFLGNIMDIIILTHFHYGGKFVKDTSGEGPLTWGKVKWNM